MNRRSLLGYLLALPFAGPTLSKLLDKPTATSLARRPATHAAVYCGEGTQVYAYADPAGEPIRMGQLVFPTWNGKVSLVPTNTTAKPIGVAMEDAGRYGRVRIVIQ